MATQFLTQSDIRARYQISDPTIWRRVREGQLPQPIRFPGSRQNRWDAEILAIYDRAITEGHDWQGAVAEFLEQRKAAG
jgi:predicted DNA-binding transcriptional regulator AlpA